MSPNRSGRLIGLLLAFLCAGTAISREARAEGLSFAEAFGTKAEPNALHYQAMILAGGERHQLEVWRDGGKRLKRRTGEAVEIYVFRDRGDDDFRMSILDFGKKIHTWVDRTSLYRIGYFTDWFDLAHGLRHPAGAYTITAVKPPANTTEDLRECRWYDLTQSGGTTHICWSDPYGIPMLMEAATGEVFWRVTRVETAPIPDSTFEIRDEGFIHNDASEDMGGD